MKHNESPLYLLREALGLVNGALSRVENWDAPLGIRGWNVREAVNHLAAQHLWAAHLVSEGRPWEVDYSGDLLKNDPLTAWRRTAVESKRVWASAQALEYVNTPAGYARADRYAQHLLTDLLVFGQQIARTTGHELPVSMQLIQACTVELHNLDTLFFANRSTDPFWWVRAA